MPYRVRKCEKCGNEFVPQKRATTCGPCRRQAKIAARRTAPEPAPVDGSRWIALTGGRFALVDEADFASVSARPWSYVKSRSGCEYAVSRVGGDNALLHRVITGAPPDVEIDHVNRDGLDNRRTNLRVATCRQNMTNKLARNRTGYKGVRYDPRRGYYASIRIEGVRTHLGVWKTAEEAARAYDMAARQHHGAFGRYNFPEPGDQPARALRALLPAG